MEPMIAITGPALAEELGVTYRQLDHWTRAGYLGTNGPTGSGHRRNYTRDEIAIARRMVRLIDAGLTPAAAARVARGEQPGNGVLILIVGDDE